MEARENLAHTGYKVISPTKGFCPNFTKLFFNFFHQIDLDKTTSL